MKKKKPIYKQIWFWIVIIVAIGLAAVNILIACLFEGEHSNLFTAISGWVSGIATAVLGFIAVLQNERYEKDNQEYLDEQKEIQNHIVEENKKQNEFAKRMSDYNEIREYYRLISDELFDLFSENIPVVLKKIIFNSYESAEKDNFGELFGISEYTENIRMKINTVFIRIGMSNYSFHNRNELMKSLSVFSDNLYEFKKYGEKPCDWEFIKSTLPNDIDNLYDDFINASSNMKVFFTDIQSVLVFFQNDKNSNEDCHKIIMKLIEKRRKDDDEINEYLKKHEMEGQDGQVENGD